MTSVLFSVFLLLQTAAPAAGVKLVPREVTGRLSVEGDAPAPSSFTLPLMPGASLTIRPQIDGTFRVLLPPGEYRVGAPLGLPAGYTLKSIVYGGTDLLRSQLKIAPADSTELLIELAINGPPPAVERQRPRNRNCRRTTPPNRIARTDWRRSFRAARNFGRRRWRIYIPEGPSRHLHCVPEASRPDAGYGW